MMIKILRISAWVFLIGVWGYTIYAVTSLPDTVPIHFNWENEPDNYGSKHTLWLLPVLGTVILGLFHWIPKAPELINYPVKITEANKTRQQQLSFLLLGYIGALIPLIFLYIIYNVIGSVRQNEINLNMWVILGAVFVPIIIYFFAANKAK